MTINDLKTNVFVMEKSIEVNSSKHKKDEEADCSRKDKGKKGKGYKRLKCQGSKVQ